MFVKEPQQYLFGVLFFPSLFFLLNILIRKLLLHKKVPISNHVIDESDAWDIAAKLVTTTYAILSTICGVTVMSATSQDLYYAQHWLTNGWARFGLAYYYYDAIIKVEGIALDSGRRQHSWILAKWKAFILKDPLMFIHHIIVPPIIYPVVIHFRRDVGDFFVASFYASDFPVPFIQFRHILARVDLKNILVYPINGLIMTIAFAICRVLIFPFLYSLVGKVNGISIWEVPALLPKKCTIGSSLLVLMQMYWLYIMLRGLFAFFRGRPGNEKLT